MFVFGLLKEDCEFLQGFVFDPEGQKRCEFIFKGISFVHLPLFFHRNTKTRGGNKPPQGENGI